MNTMVKAPPDTCPAAVCGRDEIDLIHPGRRHEMRGAYHVWVGEYTEIVMDCRDGSKSVQERGVVLSFEMAVTS